MNWAVLLLAMVWAIMENRHFGWNFTPQSDAELICDGIGFLLVGMFMLNRQSRSGGAE